MGQAAAIHDVQGSGGAGQGKCVGQGRGVQGPRWDQTVVHKAQGEGGA